MLDTAPPVLVGDIMSVFSELLSFKDAARIWGIDDSTLRKAAANGRLVDGEDIKKYGKQWIVTRAAMTRVFGTLSDKSPSP